MPDFSSHPAEFEGGINHAQNSGALNEGTISPGLSQSSASFNAQVAHGESAPHSVLQPIIKNPGGLGMSAQDSEHRDLQGHFLGAVNGVSPESYQQAAMLKLTGDNPSEMAG